MELNGLTKVGRVADSRMSDSAIRRKRIMDAKRRMAEKRGENLKEAPRSVNRIGDSAQPSVSRQPMRGVAKRRAVATQGLSRKQDSRAKTYFAVRKRIKDELEDTESTDEAIDVVLNEIENTQDLANAADIAAAAVEVLCDLIDSNPTTDANEEEGEYAEEDDYAEEEVSDSLRKRQLVRRKGISDARKKAIAKKRFADNARRRAEMKEKVADAIARKRAIRESITDARMRKANVTRKSVIVDGSNKRLVRRRG